jgi:hypothetical protein
MRRMRYFAPDGEGSGGGGGQTTQTTNQTTQTTDDSAAAAAEFRSQLEKHKGDLLHYAQTLQDKVYKLRQRAQAAEAKLPKDTEAIVPIADANALKAYREMGSAKDIAEERAELNRLRKFQMVSTAAGVAGMNPNVLSKLLPEKVKLEVGEATDEEGQAKRVVHVVEEGQDKVLLDAYATTNWSDFLPALKAGGADQSGQPWITQQSSTQGGADNGTNKVMAARLKKMEEDRKNEKPRF